MTVRSGLWDPRNRTVRAPVNPMDKSTIVSVYPRQIDEFNATIQPGHFLIPPGTYDNPAILVVGPSSWWREVDEDSPLLEIPVYSVQIAQSIITDFSNGLLGYKNGEAAPGLFYVPGEFTKEQILTSYKKELLAAKTRQENWYRALIKLADTLWARSNSNPLAISDDMRTAAKEMGLESRDWMRDFKAIGMVRCVACGGLRNPAYPICPSCKNIDMTHPEAKNLKFAQ
jgi:hypothetical protein